MCDSASTATKAAIAMSKNENNGFGVLLKILKTATFAIKQFHAKSSETINVNTKL